MKIVRALFRFIAYTFPALIDVLSLQHSDVPHRQGDVDDKEHDHNVLEDFNSTLWLSEKNDDG